MVRFCKPTLKKLNFFFFKCVKNFKTDLTFSKESEPDNF